MFYFGISIINILKYRLITYLKVFKYYLLYVLPLFKYFAKTKRLKDSHKNDYAIVFANGPSLKKIDPDKVAALQKKNFFVFAVNSYIGSKFAEKVVPDYYVLSDPAYFESGIVSVSEERKKEVKNDLSLVQQKKISLFIPSRFIKKNNNEFTYPFNDSQNIFSKNVKNPYRPRGYVSLTAYKALAMAVYMGFKKIYICGFDNDYILNLIVNEKNEIFYTDHHFYNDDANKSRIYKVVNRDSRTVGELLYYHHFLFKHLEKFSSSPIINLDRNGLVDCFSKQHDLDVYV